MQIYSRPDVAKKKIWGAVLTTAFMLLVSLGAVANLFDDPSSLYFSGSLLLISVSGVVGMLGYLIVQLKYYGSDKPLIIINDEGIWDRRWGVDFCLPWSELDSCQLNTHHPRERLFLVLRDPKSWSKKARWKTPWRALFWVHTDYSLFLGSVMLAQNM